jgi:ribonuclease P protein component
VVHLATDVAAEPSPARIGFVVGRMVGGAVVRNRVRRRLRHLVKDVMPRLPESSELVVRALPPAADSSSSALGAELVHLLDRVQRTA